MRTNPVNATLASGGRAHGAIWFDFFGPALPQICSNSCA